MLIDPTASADFQKHSLDKGRPRDWTAEVQVITLELDTQTFQEVDVLAGTEHTTTKEYLEKLIERAIEAEYTVYLQKAQEAVEAATSTLLGALSPELAAKVAQELGLKSVPVEASNSRSSGKVPDLAAQLQAKKAKGAKPNKEVEAVQEPKS
jgi:hypothetical protein